MLTPRALAEAFTGTAGGPLADLAGLVKEVVGATVQISEADGELLHLPDLTSPVYYLAGPPAMTLAMLDMLQDLGVDDDAVISAEFLGH